MLMARDPRNRCGEWREPESSPARSTELLGGFMKTKFAWLPVPLSELRGHTWYYTGTHAWLEWVRVSNTMWGDTFYVSLRKKPNAT